MHYLLFIPDTRHQDLEAAARRAGITDCIDPGFDHLPSVTGPQNLTGLMIARLGPGASQMNYDAGRQEWLPSIAKSDTGNPLYWVGIWKDSPPTEAELRRHYTQAGPRVRFGQQTWKLPTPTTVDSRAVYADDGSMRWEVTRQFAWVCDEAQAMIERYKEDFGIRSMIFHTDPTEQVGWLLKLLRINYRLTPEVAVYLDMWTGKDHIIDTLLNTLGLQRTGGVSDG